MNIISKYLFLIKNFDATNPPKKGVGLSVHE